ncbi:MAG: 4Fe-4S binding protein [Candidatus Cloacimonetes bacterium]|nr:4Fe-4S binding protein [Candidatus Cloacimonadota bacterium]
MINLIRSWSYYCKKFNDIDLNLCNSCGTCASLCPINAINLKNEHAVLTGRKCISCGMCYENRLGIRVLIRA